MAIAVENKSRFLFGAPSEQRLLNRLFNDQAHDLLEQTYDEIDASFGVKNLRRFWGTKSFSYFAQEGILRSLEDEINTYFDDEGKDITTLVPFLQILDNVQQKGAVLSQDVLVKAQQMSQRVEVYDRQYSLTDRMTTRNADGEFVRYLFPKDTEGKLHLIKVVSPEVLTLAQQVDLETAPEVTEEITQYNTALGNARLVEMKIGSIIGKQDRTKIGWYAIDYAKSDIGLVTKGPAYPNAPETMRNTKRWERTTYVSLPKAA